MNRALSKNFDYAQVWWLIMCLTFLSFFIAHDQNFLSDAVAADRSYISIIIIAAFFGASTHAAWHIFVISARINCAGEILRRSTVNGLEGSGGINDTAENQIRVTTGFEHPQSFIYRFRSAVARHKKMNNEEIAAREGALVLDVFADRLRNPSETGWYLVDILIRLGLVGTIIGFIIVLSALSEGPAPTGDNIQSLLIAMSGGMGTALYTTLAGLVCASLLGVQHMILARAIEHLISLLIDIKARVLTESDPAESNTAESDAA